MVLWVEDDLSVINGYPMRMIVLVIFCIMEDSWYLILYLLFNLI